MGAEAQDLVRFFLKNPQGVQSRYVSVRAGTGQGMTQGYFQFCEQNLGRFPTHLGVKSGMGPTLQDSLRALSSKDPMSGQFL